MIVTEYEAIPEPLFEQTWHFYQRIFTDIDTLAANRHLMYPAEFRYVADTLMIKKFLATNDAGRLLGMSVITNDLSTWPLISPHYFARHWPDHYHRDAIWYIGFVGVDREVAGTGHVFRDLITAMYPYVHDSQGLFVMDYCATNIDRGIPRLTERVVTGINPAAVLQEVDRQSFYVGHFGS